VQVIQEALDGLEQVSKRIMARVGPLDRLICKACYKEYLGAKKGTPTTKRMARAAYIAFVGGNG
jgi:hypothetical protein